MSNKTKITLSCSHQLTKGSVLVYWKDLVFDWDVEDYVRTAAYGTVCKKCYESMKENNLLLYNEEEVNKWVDGELDDPDCWW